MKNLIFITMLGLAAITRAQAQFEPHDGDRIVLVGDTLIEREQESGWLETVMDSSFPDRRFIVRNLGWSADTPAGESRASFDFADPQKGFDMLTRQVAKAKPSVVFIGYGMASSFGGAEGLDKFKRDLNRLIDTIQRDSTQQIRFVVLSPLHHYLMPPPLPDPTRHNASLSQYTEALRDIARERGMPFVDLFDWKPARRAQDFSDDGIHLVPDGYRLMALEVGRQLGWKVRVKSGHKQAVEELRRAVIRKNQLFFDRWRPENETYLFGFRKHEQGQNAHEIPEFDPLVDDLDKRIFELRDLKKRNLPPLILPQPKRPHEFLAMPDFEVAPGFEVTLWASDPMLAKPTQMNFDPKGRLWVATSSIYPQIAPGQKADDKIIVLEDTRGLGKADKSTVFASNLFIPTAVQPGDGGCYVGQGTELLHLTPDGRRRVVLSGFGTEDTHHLVHTLCWGPDGMLYFDQSIYIHTHIETPNGVVHLNSGGIFQLRPPTMQLDVFLRGFCNPWGHVFDNFGQSFVTDGAGFQGLSWGIPGATYFTYAGMRRELPSISPGQYPKFCGLEMIADSQFPDDWQGTFLTADFRAHRVARFAVAEDGAGYVTKELPDFLRTTNDTFRPIDLKFGPDGALYIADWCNPIINHGEVDFRDPRRDHDHGRIWRITAIGRPLNQRHDWTRAGNPALLAELLSTNSYDVQQSRRVLTERGKRVLPALKKWTERQSDERALLQALWMYQSLDVRNYPLLDRLLEARDGHIRAAAALVLGAWPRTDEAGGPADVYLRALQDPFPRVRVEALRAIARVPTLASAEAALNTLKPKMDPFENYALWLTMNDLAAPWLEAVQAGTWNIAGHEDQFKFAMDAIDPTLVEPVLIALLKRQSVSLSGPWIELIGHSGGADAVQTLYDKMLSGGFDKSAIQGVWTALDDAATRNVVPGAEREKVCGFFGDSDEKTRIAAIRLAGRWNIRGECLSNLFSMAADTNTPPAVREVVFESLRHIGGRGTVTALEPLTLKDEPMKIRRPAVLALAAIDVTNAGGPAILLLMDSTNKESALSTWKSLLGIAKIGPVLASAIPRAGFPEMLGAAGISAVRGSGAAEPELVLALTRSAGLQGRETELTKLEMARLVQAVAKHGDPARGERIFRRPQQNCLSCHAIGGVGGHVGPDLTSVGASAQPDYLIDSVLYPNKDIKEGFQAFLIDTKDGDAVSGIPIRENDQELVLHTAADQEVSIARNQIVSRKPGGSLMPSGLADNLNHQEQLDLFRFLSELGKPGPFDASRGDVARLWKVASEGSDIWHKAYSLVDGRLLREDLGNAAGVSNGVILAAARFRTVKTGPVHFNVSPPGDAALVIDGKESSAATELDAGEHTIALRLQADKLPEFIKLQSDDGTFLVQ
ncbi:MAG TPA: PVC-type heme-binding CxxCH protein [Verrucomicrobiae bacterium]|jgi:putative heme-binding domain-containing protein|nr:PVC-type heme-binding CxxCH protein [Verrucomicrobiae bacterium]